MEFGAWAQNSMWIFMEQVPSFAKFSIFFQSPLQVFQIFKLFLKSSAFSDFQIFQIFWILTYMWGLTLVWRRTWVNSHTDKYTDIQTNKQTGKQAKNRQEIISSVILTKSCMWGIIKCNNHCFCLLRRSKQTRLVSFHTLSRPVIQIFWMLVHLGVILRSSWGHLGGANLDLWMSHCAVRRSAGRRERGVTQCGAKAARRGG